MASKKNHSIRVDLSKVWESFKHYKIYAFIIILLLLTVRLNCGWRHGKFNFAIRCDPLSIPEVVQIISDPVDTIIKEKK